MGRPRSRSLSSSQSMYPLSEEARRPSSKLRTRPRAAHVGRWVSCPGSVDGARGRSSGRAPGSMGELRVAFRLAPARVVPVPQASRSGALAQVPGERHRPPVPWRSSCATCRTTGRSRVATRRPPAVAGSREAVSSSENCGVPHQKIVPRGEWCVIGASTQG